MLPWSADLAGRIDERVISSELLRGNPLGDPYERPLVVYLPPGYDEDPGRRYPAVYVIQGYTGNVAMWRNRSPYRVPFPEAADAVFAMVHAQPPSRELAARANNMILSRANSTPESELLRADGRRLVQSANSGDAAAWNAAVEDVCQLAGRC